MGSQLKFLFKYSIKKQRFLIRCLPIIIGETQFQYYPDKFYNLFYLQSTKDRKFCARDSNDRGKKIITDL